MPRNQEVIRQWKVLHALESSRHGVTIAALADELDVTTRTIRRDLAALQEAGFPLFDEHDDEGRVSWRLDGQLFKGLEAGFTLPELCALYLGRNLLEAVRRHAVPARPDAGVHENREAADAPDAAIPRPAARCAGGEVRAAHGRVLIIERRRCQVTRGDTALPCRRR